jgi:branched-subunit amino acid transport protein
MDNGWDIQWAFVVLIVGAIATYLPRCAGVFISGRIQANSPIFNWFGCVAYALLAGMVARMIVLPVGPLNDVSLELRVISAIGAVTVFYLSRRNVLLSVFSGIGLLMLGAWIE